MTMTTKQFSLQFAGIALVLQAVCGGCAGTGIQTDTEKPETWRGRMIWLEEKDGHPVLMAVGIADMPEMDEEGARFTAEKNLHTRVNIFIKALELSVVQVVLQRGILSSQDGRGEDPEKSGSSKTDTFASSDTLAFNATSDIEIVNSEVDEDADILRAVGFVRFDALRRAALATRKLSVEQRAALAEMSERGQDMLREALERALRNANDAS